MAAIQGAFATGAVRAASTWGTAVAAGAGNRFAGEISIEAATDTLTDRSIGSGRVMNANVARGNTLYTASVTSDLGYRNGCDTLIAVFMGTSGAPTEVTGGQGDYRHTITVADTLSKFVTLAYESTSALVHELPTCYVTAWGVSTTGVRGYIDFTASLLANTLELSTTVNTNAVLDATTFTEGTPELVIVDQDDSYRENAQSGAALAGADKLAITSLQFNMERPFELVPEIKEAAGFSAPVSSGLITGSLSMEFKQLNDHSLYTLWTAETARKARFSVEGTQIGTGVNKRFTVLVPRMVMVDAPNFALTSEGRNPVSVSFQVLQAAANPTGMTSTRPYVEIVNTLSTTLLP
jgi:hypothetical protein